MRSTPGGLALSWEGARLAPCRRGHPPIRRRLAPYPASGWSSATRERAGTAHDVGQLGVFRRHGEARRGREMRFPLVGSCAAARRRRTSTRELPIATWFARRAATRFRRAGSFQRHFDPREHISDRNELIPRRDAAATLRSGARHESISPNRCGSRTYWPCTGLEVSAPARVGRDHVESACLANRCRICAPAQPARPC